MRFFYTAGFFAALTALASCASNSNPSCAKSKSDGAYSLVEHLGFDRILGVNPREFSSQYRDLDEIKTNSSRGGEAYCEGILKFVNGDEFTQKLAARMNSLPEVQQGTLLTSGVAAMITYLNALFQDGLKYRHRVFTTDYGKIKTQSLTNLRLAIDYRTGDSHGVQCTRY